MVSYNDWELFVHEIKGKMDRGELVPDPDWQRGYIWNRRDEQLLVDSMIKGVPIPKFYLTEEYDARKGVSIHYAVDGQQRLKAAYRFLNNEFPVEIDGGLYFFKDLNVAQQQQITTYKFDGHYMRDYTQADINFLFQRLNSTGIKLTNMERWHNEFFGTRILSMASAIDGENKTFYQDIIYTPENIKRMLPLDDIIDLCNCLKKGTVEGGARGELESFLANFRDIAPSENSKLRSKFRKTMKNLAWILPRADLESSPYRKRTHFISLFLAVGLLIPKYYILSEPRQLKDDLLYFMEHQPDVYKASFLGAIRQKDKRVMRVKMLQKIVLKHARELDTKRFFDEEVKQRLWRRSRFKHFCQICGRGIRGYQDAVVDHIEPWAKGGKKEESNAQLAHRACNQRKVDREEEFIIV